MKKIKHLIIKYKAWFIGLVVVMTIAEVVGIYFAVNAPEETVIPIVIPTATPIITPTIQPTITPTPTLVITPTITPTSTPTVTPIITPTVTPTSTPIPTPTEYIGGGGGGGGGTLITSYISGTGVWNDYVWTVETYPSETNYLVLRVFSTYSYGVTVHAIVSGNCSTIYGAGDYVIPAKGSRDITFTWIADSSSPVGLCSSNIVISK